MRYNTDIFENKKEKQRKYEKTKYNNITTLNKKKINKILNPNI